MSYNFSPLKEALSEIHEWLSKEYTQISTGRANPALLDTVMVESYGSKQPIKNVASINIEDARTLRITPWDKGQIKDIERALRESGLPFSVAVDAEGVRANIPQLTSENKQSLTKLVREKLEQARVRVRAERQKVEKEIENGDFSKDEVFGFKKTMQELIDDANKTLEEHTEKKEADITAV